MKTKAFLIDWNPVNEQRVGGKSFLANSVAVLFLKR